MRWRPAGFDGEGMFEFERPEGKIVPVAAEIAHGTAAEVPPAIPFRTREIDFVEWPLGGRTKPEVPMHSLRNWHRLCRTFVHENDILVSPGGFFTLATPGAPDPNMGFGDWANRAA